MFDVVSWHPWSRIEFFQSIWDQLAHERAKNDCLKRKIERLERVGET
jgi:hypothetical protein